MIGIGVAKEAIVVAVSEIQGNHRVWIPYPGLCLRNSHHSCLFVGFHLKFGEEPSHRCSNTVIDPRISLIDLPSAKKHSRGKENRLPSCRKLEARCMDTAYQNQDLQPQPLEHQSDWTVVHFTPSSAGTPVGVAPEIESYTPCPFKMSSLLTCFSKPRYLE